MEKLGTTIEFNLNEGKKLECLSERYLVFKEGFVWDTIKRRPVKFFDVGNGYLSARLQSPIAKHHTGTRHFKLYRLVAMAFLDGFREDLTIDHKDFNKSNNHITNLECVTLKENIRRYHEKRRSIIK